MKHYNLLMAFIKNLWPNLEEEVSALFNSLVADEIKFGFKQLNKMTIEIFYK